MKNLAMQQALIDAGCTRTSFQHYKGRVKEIPVSPLVIMSDIKTDGHGHYLRNVRQHVSPVLHITGIGENMKAVTKGGDVFSFVNEGNGFLRAVQ